MNQPKTLQDIKGVQLKNKHNGEIRYFCCPDELDDFEVISNGDLVYVIDERTLRTERYVCKFSFGYCIVAIKKSKDRCIIPKSYWINGPTSFHGDISGLDVKRDFIKFFYKTPRARCLGNVFLSLNDCNKALDDMINKKTFNTLPFGSHVYFVDKKDKTLSSYRLISSTLVEQPSLEAGVPQFVMVMRFQSNGMFFSVILGQSRFERHSAYSVDYSFSTDLFFLHPNDLYIFTVKEDAEDFLRCIKRQYVEELCKIKLKPNPIFLKQTKRPKPMNYNKPIRKPIKLNFRRTF